MPMRPYRPLSRCHFAVVCALGHLFPLPALAISNITADRTTPTSITQSGAIYAIGGGLQAGANLFHSFGEFKLGAGDTAAFRYGTGTNNVISRVTGGSASSINGRLTMTATGLAGTPSFWFVNPAGVTFGAGAEVDVPGAFHVSTASYLKFADGTRFYADTARTSTFSSADPVAFGFLSTAESGPRAPVTVNGGAVLSSYDSSLSIVAGDVVLDNGSVHNDAGDIRVVAFGTQVGEVPVKGDLPVAALGHIQLSGGAVVTSAFGATNAGSVSAWADTVSVDGMGTGLGLESYSDSAGNAGKVSVTAGGAVNIKGEGIIASFTNGPGNAGDVVVNAGSLTISGAGTNGIFTSSGGAGNAGNVAVTCGRDINVLDGGYILSASFLIDGYGYGGNVYVSARNVTVSGGGSINSNTSGFNPAGAIYVDAQNLTVQNRGFISSNTDGGGAAGDIEVSASGAVRIRSGGAIESSTAGGGYAGFILVEADSLSIDARGSGVDTGIFSHSKPGATGDAGYIRVRTANDVTIQNGGQIASNTFGPGFAGYVDVAARRLTIDSMGSGVDTGIFSESKAGAVGSAGYVVIAVTDEVKVLDDGAIKVQTSGIGNAGDIELEAGSLTIDGSGGLFVRSGSPGTASGGDGNAGTITAVVAGDVSVMNGGWIDSSNYSSGKGSAGGVGISAGGSVLVNNFASINSDTFGKGDAGHVIVNAGQNVTVSDSAYISSDTSGSGYAGYINISAGNDVTVASDGYISSSTTGIGDAGYVEINAGRTLAISSGGQISSNTSDAGYAGYIRVNAGSLIIDSMGSAADTGIFSESKPGATGAAGYVDVTVTGDVKLLGDGAIKVQTSGAGDAGNIDVSAGSLTIDGSGGLFVRSGSPDDGSGGDGNAGAISVITTGDVKVLNGGWIDSSNYGGGAGSAGGVDISAGGSVLVDNVASINSDTSGTGDAGHVAIDAGKNLTVSASGYISSDTSGAGNAGYIIINVGNDVNVSSDGFISSSTTDFGDAGYVEITARRSVTLASGGQISSNTSGPGFAGFIQVDAGSLTIDALGSGADTGIFSNSQEGATGDAGFIRVTVSGDVVIRNGGQIATNTYDSGYAGYIEVSAKNVTIDAMDSDADTGIFSKSVGGTGSAGVITVEASGAVSIKGDGRIESSTSGDGDAGSIDVIGVSSLTIDGSGGLFVRSGDSGDFTGGDGKAGTITVDSKGDVQVLNYGWIDSSSYTYGGAGSAGGVSINAGGSVLVADFASINSETNGIAPAGSIVVNAQNVSLDRGGFIDSSTWWTGFIPGLDLSQKPNAGKVNIMARGDISLSNGGYIRSDTHGFGRAGDVAVAAAGNLTVDGGGDAESPSAISATAHQDSYGQTGIVSVSAKEGITLANGAEIAIRNDSLTNDRSGLIPTRMTVAARNITLSNGAKITAESSGIVNASDIVVNFSDSLRLDPTAISASAVDGNGGSISIFGGPGSHISLDGSAITTSVTGSTSGNGGNITIQTQALMMKNGFIQANTAAPLASGGEILIDVTTLIPSGGTLLLGGATPHEFLLTPGYNVIQAASPTGLSGNITVTAPSLDIAGSLVELKANVLDTGGFGRSPCASSGGSSFAQSGRGGLPSSSFGALRAEAAPVGAVAGATPFVLSALGSHLAECKPI